MKKVLLLISIFLFSVPCWAAITITNNKASGFTSTANRSAPAFTNALTNPSMVFAVCKALSGSGDTSAATDMFAVPTDTAGDVFVDVQVGLMFYDGEALSEEMFYALNNSHTTASNIVTCHSNTGAVQMAIIAWEFTGLATSGPIDAKFYNTEQINSIATLTMGNQSQYPTTVNGDLIIAEFGAATGGLSAGSGWTQISATGGEVEYQIQGTAGAVAPTATDATTSGDHWGGIWAAFTPSGTSAKPTNQYRNDFSATADGTSLGNSWVLRHAQATTSDSLNALTAQMTLTTNPVAGDLFMCTNQFFPVSSLHLVCSDSLGTVAKGNVTTTASHTVTFHDGIAFNMQGDSAESGGTNDWVGKTVTLGSAGTCTVAAVASQTSLTCTQTLTTNATPQSYVGPSLSCSDVGDGAAISMDTCRGIVGTGGADTVTITATIAATNFDLGGTVYDIYYSGGTVKGEDTAACPTANCLEQDLTSNASTGIVSQNLTLASTGELVWFGGDGLVGPAYTTSGSAAGIIGVSSAALSNLYCIGTSAFCINEIQGVFKSFAGSGSQSVNGITDVTKNEQFTTQAFAFQGTPSAASSNMPPVIY